MIICGKETIIKWGTYRLLPTEEQLKDELAQMMDAYGVPGINMFFEDTDKYKRVKPIGSHKPEFYEPYEYVWCSENRDLLMGSRQDNVDELISMLNENCT